MPSGKREAASYHLLKATAAAQPEEIRTRRTGAELAGAKLLGRLGAEGTYDQAPTGGVPETGEEGASIFKTEKATSKAATAIDTRYTSKDAIQDITSLDPEQFVKAQEGTAQFRIMSRLTAEAEQLIARKGPLYEEMLNNQQLPIIEGAAAMARENTAALRKAMRRGGSARRAGMEAAQKMRAQNAQNSQTMQAVSKVRADMDKWARSNATDVLAFGQNWAQNQFGIRESYQSAMDGASKLMLTNALPIMFEATGKAAEWRYYAHAKNRQKVGRWVSGVMGVVSMAAGLAGGSELITGAIAGEGGGGFLSGVRTAGAEILKSGASDLTEWGAKSMISATSGVQSPADPKKYVKG